MSTIDDLPPLDPELEALLAAERVIPPPPAGLDARVLARIGAALGWSGGGGAGGAGLAAKLLLGALAVLIVAGGGYLAVRDRDHDRARAASPAATAAAVPGAAARHRPPTGEDALPAWFGDPARAAQPIAGRVVRAGAPVAGARVVLTSNASRGGLLAPVEVVTGADGRFALGPHRAAVYDVTASAPGAGEGHVRVNTLIREQPPSTDLTIALPGCDHVLHGVVRDASGGVVAGAEVVRARGKWRDVSPLGLGVTTDDHGTYELCVPPGPVTAIVRADGYGSLTILDTVLGRRRVDVELIPGATIVGRVVRADTGAPVAGAAVRLSPAALRPRVRATAEVAVSGTDGRFRIAGVAAGRHLMWADATDAALAMAATVLVDPGQESAEIVLALDPLATVLRGVVRVGGHPLAGVQVFARADGKRTGSWPPTDPDGRFTLRLARPGSFALEVDDYTVVTPTTLDVRGSLDGVTVEVAARGEIRGRVVRAGRPIAGAEVLAFSPVRDAPATTTTDATGGFTLRGLAPGAYAIGATSYDVAAFSSESRTARVTITGAEIVDGVTVELDGGAAIAGTVVDQDGAAVAGAAVQFADPASGDLCQAVTGPDGEFDCAMLAGGRTYAPRVRLDPESALSFDAATADGLAPVAVADGATRVAGVVLRVRVARDRLRGRIVTTDGAPYPDVTVRAIEETTGYTAATAPWVGVRAAISDGDGRFELDAVAGARYTLHARAPGGAEATVTGVIAGATAVTLRLDEPGRVRGTLVGFAGQPQVRVHPLGNTIEGALARVDGDHFVVDGLAPGPYALLAAAGSQGAAEAVTVRAGADTVVALRPRPGAHLDGRVVDFVTGAPVAGARCSVAPYVDGANVLAWGTAIAAPTDAGGRFALDVPSGAIEVSCVERPTQHGGGAGRLAPRAGEAATITIPVVTSPTSSAASNGIGARWLLGAAGAGYTHTIVELRPGGAAERAGLRVGDAVTAVDGRDVAPLADVERLLGLHPVGATIALDYRRGGATRRTTVTLEGPWWR